MSEQAILTIALVLGIAAFAVSLWALALSLYQAEQRRAAHSSSPAERIRRCITRDKAALEAAALRAAAQPDTPSERSAYQAAALALAEDYEELCELLIRNRKNAEAAMTDTYGEEIRAWVEEGPLRDEYRFRVPAYPATAEIWRLTRTAGGQKPQRAA